MAAKKRNENEKNSQWNVNVTVRSPAAGWRNYQADETDTLIKLDKKWGEARGADAVAPLLSDDVTGVSVEGTDGKKEMLADADANPPPEGPYQAADYKVRFLSDDIAIMTHSISGEDPHRSLHVWQKLDGRWKVPDGSGTDRQVSRKGRPPIRDRPFFIFDRGGMRCDVPRETLRTMRRAG